ncbi:MAG: VWA domain-containing protein [Phycisphaeraceae bacterium]|nr:VWA domain-containing protein [Phycisphaeraceae bacterium]
MPCVHGEPALPPVHGGTNFSQVLYQINDIHKQRPGRRKTAIIISDGEPSEGETDPTRLAHDAGELRADTRVTLVGVHVGFDEGYDILARLVGDEELTFRVGDESEMLTKLAGIVRAVVESTVTNVAPAIAIKQALVPGEASAS